MKTHMFELLGIITTDFSLLHVNEQIVIHVNLVPNNSI